MFAVKFFSFSEKEATQIGSASVINLKRKIISG
jgi:hypothetical protein